MTARRLPLDSRHDDRNDPHDGVLPPFEEDDEPCPICQPRCRPATEGEGIANSNGPLLLEDLGSNRRMVHKAKA
jgi:hypothetical protein